MRGSVGSSADILLTPIRGSTALSDDFVLVPTGHSVEPSSPDDIASPQSECCESPGPTVETILTEPETHHPVEHEPHVVEVEDVALEEPELEEPNSPMAHSFVSETHTITNAAVETPPEDIAKTPAVPFVAAQEPDVMQPPPVSIVTQVPTKALSVPTKEPEVIKPPPVNIVVQVPTRAPTAKGITHVARSVPTSPAPPARPPLTVHVTNVIPFPSDIEGGRLATPIKVEVATPTVTSTLDHHQNSGVAWFISAWQTASGIMLLAIECYRWLIRKGLRDDFRSCMSYWFLKELVIGFVLPICLVPVALWLLFRTMHLHHDPTGTAI